MLTLPYLEAGAIILNAGQLFIVPQAPGSPVVFRKFPSICHNHVCSNSLFTSNQPSASAFYFLTANNFYFIHAAFSVHNTSWSLFYFCVSQVALWFSTIFSLLLQVIFLQISVQRFSLVLSKDWDYKLSSLEMFEQVIYFYLFLLNKTKILQKHDLTKHKINSIAIFHKQFP